MPVELCFLDGERSEATINEQDLHTTDRRGSVSCGQRLRSAT